MIGVMNLLLYVTSPFGGYVSRLVVNDLSEVIPAIEASDHKRRLRLQSNEKALERVGSIMNGEVKPYRSFIAGNDYFGRVQFKYERADMHDPVPKTFFLSVQVFSALGATIEEHDSRYKKNKTLRYGPVRTENCQV